MPAATSGAADTSIDAAVDGRGVLVTGATVFIGARLSQVLQRSGAEVHGGSRTARELIGWEPSTPLDAGLAQTVRWFLAQDR